jgi:hypothetical protein
MVRCVQGNKTSQCRQQPKARPLLKKGGFAFFILPKNILELQFDDIINAYQGKY